MNYKNDSNIERALILHNTGKNDHYLGHSQIILMKNNGSGILYSYEYDIKSVFAYDIYKNHRKFYDKFENVIDVVEQVRVMFKTKSKHRKIELSSDQIINIINKKALSLPKKEDSTDYIFQCKQINYVNKQLQDNPYSPMAYYFDSYAGEKMLQKAEDIHKNPGIYYALHNNCVQNMTKILNAGGIDAKDTFLPYLAAKSELKEAKLHEKQYEQLNPITEDRPKKLLPKKKLGQRDNHTVVEINKKQLAIDKFFKKQTPKNTLRREI